MSIIIKTKSTKPPCVSFTKLYICVFLLIHIVCIFFYWLSIITIYNSLVNKDVNLSWKSIFLFLLIFPHKTIYSVYYYIELPLITIIDESIFVSVCFLSFIIILIADIKYILFKNYLIFYFLRWVYKDGRRVIALFSYIHVLFVGVELIITVLVYYLQLLLEYEWRFNKNKNVLHGKCTELYIETSNTEDVPIFD